MSWFPFKKNRKDFINKAQHPEDGMLVVGEAVSRDQGWVEGALESVNIVLNDMQKHIIRR